MLPCCQSRRVLPAVSWHAENEQHRFRAHKVDMEQLENRSTWRIPQIFCRIFSDLEVIAIVFSCASMQALCLTWILSNLMIGMRHSWTLELSIKIRRYCEGQKNLEIFIITQVSSVVLYPQNCCGQEEDGPWSPDSKASCLARYFQCHSQSMADGLGCLWWIWGTLWWTAVRFFTASGRHAPFGLWPAHAMCILANSWSSLDSVVHVFRCVLVVAMSRPIFSRAPRMARLLWGPQNAGGVLDSLDECRARDTVQGKAMWNVSVEEMLQKTVQKTRD